ncbi:MAG: endo alpha-1,4 polygalactosaminidase [Elusimicrobia bacterium]|nr:endo alpha-1,4 polygalactosaminidase [Elusimicrobiota bacterium]
MNPALPARLGALRRAVTRRLGFAALAALSFCGPCLAADRPRLDGARRWACFYGRILSTAAWQSLDLAVVDPDSFSLPPASGPVRLAYVSAGEAHESRWWWASASSRSFIVEPNPGWPGAHRVDLRSDEWRKLLLDQVVPAALAKGYQGVMLDTIDTAGYLESKDKARFAGSVDAAVDLVRRLREDSPGAAILVNNALPLLERIGPMIDGVVVEDLYTRCPPKGGVCVPTPKAVSQAKERALEDFAVRTGKPVFVLLYSTLPERDERWIRAAVRRCLKNGFRPYLTSPSLTRMGRVFPPREP